MRRTIIASLVALALVPTADAQTTAVTPGWAAFSGCWKPVAVDGGTDADDARLCVIPVGTNDADLVTVRNGAEAERTRIAADGRHHDVARQGCAGWESAAFSSDGRRLYLDGEQQCANGLTRKSSGIFAIAHNGQWINVVNVGADSANDLRVVRYALAGEEGVPADLRRQVEARELSDRTARIAAQSRVSLDAIVEASRFLTAPVLEGWLSEQGQTFDLDDKSLVRLADNDVAPSVIDVMIAVSNPRAFAVRMTGSGISTEENPDDVTRRRERHDACVAPVFDPWGYYAYDPCDPYRRYGYYGSSWSRYGSRYNPYYDPYGSYYAPGYRPVVVIVRGSDNDPDRGHGRMTKNGYQRGTSQSGGTASSSGARPTASTSRARDPEQEKSSGSSGSGSSGSSSGRTATRKPPAN